MCDHMPLDATCISCMVQELSATILDARIEKVSQPERDEIVLLLRTADGNKRLIISANPQNPRMHLTEKRKKNPDEAPMFCMLLRKHLGGGRITSISQPTAERVIQIHVTARNEMGDVTERTLSAEFAGRNTNIILLDADGKIIDAVHHTDLSAGRGILPGLLYTPMKPQEKANALALGREGVIEALSTLSSESQAHRAIVRLFAGIGPLAAKCIAKNATGNEDCLLNGNLEKVSDALLSFLDDAEAGRFSPCVIIDKDGLPVDYTAYAPSIYKDILQVYPRASLSAAMEDFFSVRDTAARMLHKSAALRKRIGHILDRLHKKISIHTETLAEAAEMERFKIYGELICANLYKIPQGATQVTVENFYNQMEPIDIPLDKAKSPSQNAQVYFKKYRKMKTAIAVVGRELEKSRSEAAYMETVEEALQRAEDETALAEIQSELCEGGYIKEETKGKRKKEKPSAPLEMTIDGFSVLIGRTGRQNDLVTFKLSRAEDIWLHVKNMPGAHTLIRANRQDVPDAVVRQAAEYAAYYSAGRGSAQVPVDYTAVKNVWKPSGAAPGMVLYKGQKTVYVTPYTPQIVE